MAEQQPLPLTKLSAYTVATVPDAASFKQCIIYVSNGSAGNPCIAVSDGSVWKVTGGGTTISAT